MADMLLQAEDVSKHFGGFVALNEVSISLKEGDRFGLIGPNGSGKTTLINCISGALLNDGGRILFKNQDVTTAKAHQRARMGIARSFQIPKPFRSMSVIQNLMIPLEFAAQGRVEFERIREEAAEILRLVAMDDKAEENSGNLTQIEMRKLELARALAAKPSLLISDEAMAGLSSSEVDEVLEILLALNTRGVAVIMIEHIMRAVMRFSDHIVVLDAGRKIAEGAPEEIVRNPDVERAYLGE